MPAPGNVLEPSLTEVSFVKSALLSSIRTDGRSFLQARSIDVQFDKEELGWVEVRVNGTKGTQVVVSTHATLVAPRPDRPYEGFVDVRAEVQPMAGWQFERGRTNEEEVAFERGLDRAIRRSDVVDREALCVVAGNAVWSITLNVHLLSAAGGATLDVAVLACITALRHFRRPDASVSSSSSSSNVGKPKVTVHDPSERVPISLALHHHPLCVSFAIFDPAHMTQTYVSGVGAGSGSIAAHASADQDDEANMIILVDPTPLETLLCTSKLMVVANVQGEVCVLDKAGGRPLSEAVVNRVIGLARLRIKEVNELMEKALQRDASQRVIEVN